MSIVRPPPETDAEGLDRDRGRHDHAPGQAEDEDAHHGHSHGLVDPSIKRSRDDVRVVLTSLALLGVTGLIQAGIYIATDSVALLADLIHNFGDADRDTAGRGVPAPLRPCRAGGRIGGRADHFRQRDHRRDLRRVAHHPSAPADASHRLGPGGGVGVAGNAAAARVRLAGGRRLDSPALIADGNHARSDALVSVGVILSATAVALGAPIADPIVGLLITALILRITWESWNTVRGQDGADSSSASGVGPAIAGSSRR